MSSGVYECQISHLSAWGEIFDQAVRLTHGMAERYGRALAVPLVTKASVA
jgi:hypothetical protein